jgi:hypothetical protein
MDHERHMNLARFTKYNDEKEIFKIIPWLQTIYINHLGKFSKYIWRAPYIREFFLLEKSNGSYSYSLGDN